MRIAVTGGSGFIGAATVRQAEERGHIAWPFDRAGGHDILGDLSALDGADVIVHLAGVLGTAELFDEPEHAIDVNITGALRVLQHAEITGAHFVGICMPDVFPSVYTATKVCAARLATAWYHSRSVPVSHVRAFNAFGPGQAHGPGHPQKIIPTFAAHAWAGEPIPIWGDGTQGVDLVHTDEVARMLISAAELGGDDITFDAGTGRMFTVNEVAEMVLDITGSRAGINYLPMRDGEEPTKIVADGDGWDRLDWKPEFRHEDLVAAVEHYRV